MVVKFVFNVLFLYFLHFVFSHVCEVAKKLDIQGVMHNFEWALINSVYRWFMCDQHLG